jgi:epoxyqueuosine reductase
MSKSEMTGRIIDKAKYLGATLVGVANVDLLKHSPSHLLSPKMDPNLGVGSRETPEGIKPGEVTWPTEAKSAVVIAVEHREDQPELDWWYGKKSPLGNRILIEINNVLSEWIEETFQISNHKLPYHVEKGGIFLKDAAVMAGLGCIGKNNILVTPDYGPRIRLRAMLLDEEISPTGPIDFDPCSGCDEPCRQACPQNAFDRLVLSPAEMGLEILPGRTGCFSRAKCNIQMEKDIDAAEEKPDPENGEPSIIIKYCRRCELSCPVGQ